MQLIREMLQGRDPSPEAEPESGGMQFIRDLLTTGIFGFAQEQARDFQRDPLSTKASASAFERGRPALGALLAAAGAAGVIPASRAPSGVLQGTARATRAARPTREQIIDDFIKSGPSAEEIVLNAPKPVGGVRGQIIDDFITGGKDRETFNSIMEEVVRERLLDALIRRR